MVILGLGSNLGDRLLHLKKAVSALSKFISDIKTSHIYESDALVPKEAPDSWDIKYLNMALSGKTNLEPHDLLKKIKDVENKLGRNENHEFWSPREIDIDIIDYEGVILGEDKLTIPHKHLLERAFFLLPISDIESNWKFPIKESKSYGKTAKELLNNIENDFNIKRTDFKIDD